MTVDSILDSVKKTLGVDPSLTVFDADIIMHINTAFATLTQIGVGPSTGFANVDDSATWDEFILNGDPTYNSVKTYVFLRVRLLFDPPATSYLINAYEKQVEELEWRLNVRRETDDWVDPNPPPPVEEVL